MNYWADLFDCDTWRESRAYGLRVSGYAENMIAQAERIQPGDVLLCYVVGAMRWVGALEVLGRSTDTVAVWTKDTYPVRFDVRPIVALDLEKGVPMRELDDRKNPSCVSTARHALRGMVRASPTRFTHIDDALAVMDALKERAR